MLAPLRAHRVRDVVGGGFHAPRGGERVEQQQVIRSETAPRREIAALREQERVAAVGPRGEHELGDRVFEPRRERLEARALGRREWLVRLGRQHRDGARIEAERAVERARRLAQRERLAELLEPGRIGRVRQLGELALGLGSHSGE